MSCRLFSQPAPKVVPARPRRTVPHHLPFRREKFSPLILDLDDEDHTHFSVLSRSRSCLRSGKGGCVEDALADMLGHADLPQTPIYAHVGKDLQDKAAKSSATP